jgi:AcrR family transcriptional regulator
LIVFAEKGFHGTSVPEVSEAAGVGTGTLYRYFANKEGLVNELYRETKQMLRAALMDDMPAPDSYKADDAERWFMELWTRLGVFAQTEPEAFRFLEMQDHTPYLDAESKQLELSVLLPLVFAGKRMRSRGPGASIEILIALVWGAFVGLVKASRLGYLGLDDARLAQAGAACWRMIAPDVPRARER